MISSVLLNNYSVYIKFVRNGVYLLNSCISVKHHFLSFLSYFPLRKSLLKLYLIIVTLVLAGCTEAPEKILQAGNEYYKCKSQQTLPGECDSLNRTFKKAILEAKVAGVEESVISASKELALIDVDGLSEKSVFEVVQESSQSSLLKFEPVDTNYKLHSPNYSCKDLEQSRFLFVAGYAINGQQARIIFLERILKKEFGYTPSQSPCLPLNQYDDKNYSVGLLQHQIDASLKELEKLYPDTQTMLISEVELGLRDRASIMSDMEEFIKLEKIGIDISAQYYGVDGGFLNILRATQYSEEQVLEEKAKPIDSLLVQGGLSNIVTTESGVEFEIQNSDKLFHGNYKLKVNRPQHKSQSQDLPIFESTKIDIELTSKIELLSCNQTLEITIESLGKVNSCKFKTEADFFSRADFSFPITFLVKNDRNRSLLFIDYTVSRPSVANDSVYRVVFDDFEKPYSRLIPLDIQNKNSVTESSLKILNPPFTIEILRTGWLVD